MIKGGVKRSTLNFLHALTTGAQRKKGTTAMAGWRTMKRLLVGIPLVGLFVLVSTSCSANPQERRQRPGTPAAAPQEKIDLKEKPLDRIPVGTVIGRQPPEGWSHLVLLAIPTLTREDERDAPRMATHYAQMFKFTVLANVARRRDDRAPFYLERVARGFATTVDGKQVIVRGKDTMGADLGLFGRRILDENEQVLDNDVRQVVRTATMLIFDAQAVMLRDGKHVNMVMRHAILVDPATGRLYTLVWLLNRDYQRAENAIQLLPEGMRERRLLSVKRDKFSRLGIPERDAFGLRQIPQGKAIAYTDALKEAACVKTFDAAKVPLIEERLRTAAIQNSGR
jgi:hypothetical protein